MNDYKEKRPEKEVFPEEKQRKLKKKAKKYVKEELFPDSRINKIILFGSLAKEEFGKYKEKYKDRIYSDIDFLLLVENDFKVLEDWKIHFEGDSDFKGDLYKVYNNGKLNERYLIQYMVCRRKSYTESENREVAEKWGVPLKLEKSDNDYEVIYSK